MSEEKVYPYIGYWKATELTVLFVANREGFDMEATENYSCEWSEHEYKNITNEYLQNTYGEVASPEHAEFIVELAESAGFDIWRSRDGINPVSFTIVNNELQLFELGIIRLSLNGLKQITIPLPPKADKQDVSEWPQVGDEVVTRGGSNGVVKINKPDKDGMIVCDFDGEYALTYKSELSKPKTPEEELRDDIVWLTIKHMENKPYSTEDNAYYLFSDLMGKYNITKKV